MNLLAFHVLVPGSAPPDPPDPPASPCFCNPAGRNTDTLANLRRRMLVRMGYAGVANNPPPGMAALVDDLLAEAQRNIYERVAGFRQERYFEWTMREGVTRYCYAEGDDDCGGALVPELTIGAYMVDEWGRWTELVAGIPDNVRGLRDGTGIPRWFEYRGGIEVWPAPGSRPLTLTIKSKADLRPLVENTDRTTIDADAVFLTALANAKAHYGKPDAQVAASMAQQRIATLAAGEHYNRRYVPGTAPATPPMPPILKGGFQ